MFNVSFYETADAVPKLDALLELMRLQLLSDGITRSLEAIRSSLARALHPGSPARLIVLYEGGLEEPVGFAFFNIGSGLESGGGYIWLNEIHLAGRCRGQGGGRMLVEALRDWGRRNRMKAIYGVCGVNNRGAQSFYQRLGFAAEEAVWISRPIDGE